MHRVLFLVIGLFFGFGSGFFFAAAKGITLDGHDHGGHETAVTTGHEAHANHNDTVELALEGDLPMVSATLLRDPVSGWNLQVEATAFSFSPEKAGLAHVDGEGHAHVYADGKKIARHYGDWLHIEALPPGARELRVSLNANDHRGLAVNGKPVETILVIPES